MALWWVPLLTATLLACFHHSCAVAAETVVLGADQRYPPFSFATRSGQPTGFDIELFREVARHAGLRTDHQLGEWEATLGALDAGKVDVVPMFFTEDRAQRFLFSTPFLDRYHLAFGVKGSSYVDGVPDLVGHRVAAQVAGAAWERLDGVAGVTLVPVRSEGEALVAVATGRADYALVPAYIGYEATRRHDLDDVVALSAPLLRQAYGFAVAPGREALLARINEGLKEASQSGDHDRLYAEWLGSLVSERDSYRSGLTVGIWIAIPLFAAAALLLVWWRRARSRAAAEMGSRQSAEARLEYLALHDPGTGLLNRHGLGLALDDLVQRGAPFALVRLECIETETIEAIAGPSLLDRLMAMLGSRLDVAATSCTVARTAANRFAVLLTGPEREEAQARMEWLVDLMQRPVSLEGLSLQPSCCAGAALFPEHGGTPDRIATAAGIACAAARAKVGSSRMYAPHLAPDPRNLTLLTDLRSAILEGTLGYALQPKLDLVNRRICGAELLVRWNHPEYGPLPPAAFVPLAEKGDVIGEMTLYLIGRAALHCRTWRAAGTDLSLAVNVSANDLCDQDVVRQILDVCREVGERLVLEITETAVMRDPDAALLAVERLRACGIRISLDDFGTGNASLTYLRRLAPDEVKVDRSFTGGVSHSAEDRSIIRSTIDLAHSLGASVTAEGVEDLATLTWLAESGCDCAQGYFIAEPLPVDRFEALVADGRLLPDKAGRYVSSDDGG